MKVSLFGKKIGMTRIFKEDGQVVAVTAIEVLPALVTALKNTDKEGYKAIQLACGDVKDKHVNKPKKGFFSKIGVNPKKKLYEIRCTELPEINIGDEVSIDNFEVGDYVDITAVSKGKGFQGVMKRHNFSGGRATHGDSTGRGPGSIGQSANPSRVFKGMRGPGQMGNKQVTIQNLEIVKIDSENNLILVDGSVPGAKQNMVKISLSLKKGKDKDLVFSKNAKNEEIVKDENVEEEKIEQTEITEDNKTEEKQD